MLMSAQKELNEMPLAKSKISASFSIELIQNGLIETSESNQQIQSLESEEQDFQNENYNSIGDLLNSTKETDFANNQNQAKNLKYVKRLSNKEAKSYQKSKKQKKKQMKVKGNKKQEIKLIQQEPIKAENTKQEIQKRIYIKKADKVQR